MNNNGFCVGKTLKTLAKELPADFHHGYSVYLLKNEKDDTGILVDDSFSISSILKKHPELSDAKVKLVNDYYGTTVLRVLGTQDKGIPVVEIKEAKKVTSKDIPQTCNYCAHNAVCDHNKYGFENCGHFLPYFI